MNPKVQALVDIGDKLFAARPLALWQALAENFHPMRADFYPGRSADDEVVFNMSSVPILMRRELAESISVNIRPRHLPWFELSTEEVDLEDDFYAKGWLEYATKVIRRALYDPLSGFVKATRETDDDWTTFGQAVILPGLNRNRDRLLFQNFHIRDCAWSEGANGVIDTMHRRWEPTARQLCYLFPKTVGDKVKKIVKENPEQTIACRHIVVPRDNYVYDSGVRGGDFISLIIDTENKDILEEVGQKTFRYVVPRWLTVSNTPFARSPVCEVMLPDARTMQALTRIVLEAGEKAVDPSTILSEEVFRSDLDLRSGGITWADLEYDQRLQDKFAVLTTDKSGLPVAIQLSQMLTAALRDGFYLNKLAMPNPDRERVTAYEIRKALEKHIREVAPVYEPIEEVYSAPLLDETLSIMLQHNAFGPANSLPESLLGKDVRFTFRSPLREAEKELAAHRFTQGAQLLQVAAQFDPAAPKHADMGPAVRDSLKGIGWENKWMTPPEEVEQAREQLKQAEMMQTGVQAIDAAGGASEKAGKGMKAIAEALGGAELEGAGDAA